MDVRSKKRNRKDESDELSQSGRKDVVPMGSENSIEQRVAHYNVNRYASMTKTRDDLDF